MGRTRGKEQECIGEYPTAKDAAYRCAAYTTESPAEEMEAVSRLEAAIAGNKIPEIRGALDGAPYGVREWQAVGVEARALLCRLRGAHSSLALPKPSAVDRR